MKILVINWRDIKNPEAGGAEIHIDEILKRKPENWNIDFICASFKGSVPNEDYNGYKIIRIPNNSLFNFTFKNYWNKELKKRNYDLIIDDISKIPLATPQFIKNIPVLSILHHIHGKSLFSQLPYPFAFYVYHMEKYFLRAYQNTPLIVVSDSTKNELSNLYQYKQLSVSHNGIDFNQLNRGYDNSIKKPPHLLYFGRLKKYKRIDHIIEALKIIQKTIPEAILNIAGKGDDEDRLKEKCKFLNLTTSVNFLGFISEDQKIDLLKKSALYVIPSEKEGWGISVIESNAAGLPSIGYNVEGLKDSIKHEYSGLLIENGNIQKLADGIINLLTDEN
ncbi:MAG: hypothetical protein A2355_07305, partial [Spirochaetes bacterium RIFOXYB1_FULL_32_8]